MTITRCTWVNDDPVYIAYHDEEWGKPLKDDLLLFELLMLEGMQAGLSWYTVLKKRENFRKAFDNFDPQKMALYGDDKIAELMQDEGIIRNRLKINGVIRNAQIFLQICEEEGSFAEYLWSFIGGKPVVNHWQSRGDVPATTPQSDNMSKALKKRGMKFVGSTICYAFMQASGMVDDHALDCFCRSTGTVQES